MARVAIKLAATLSVLPLALACRGGGHAEERPPSRPEGDAKPSKQAKPPAKPEKVLSVEGQHELPVKFPAAKPAFTVGQRALAVPQSWLDNALAQGVDGQVISLYDASIEALGAERSKVKSQSGASWTIPNALIVALPPAAKVRPGDLVLTHWPQGGSWMRAVVTDGPAESPQVRLLDVPVDEPAGWGKRSLNLDPGSFLPLDKPGQSGTTAACKQGAAWRRFLVIHTDADVLLGLGFGGKLASLPRAGCQLLPLAPKLEVGSSVKVPRGNEYLPATVLGVSSGAVAPKQAPAQTEAKGDAAPPAPSKASVDAGDAPAVPAPGRVRVELQVPPRLTLELPQLDVASELPD
ncbi:MAG: hypothetical protein R3B89_18665 [Polyangiaceae bacterium]